MPMTLTVITVTRLRPEWLAQCVRSLAAQRCDRFELVHLVVSDDCDETSDAALQLRNRTPVRTELLHTTRPTGMGSGAANLARLRNRAIRASDGELLAFLDDDCTVDSDHYSSLVDCIEASNAGAVHSQQQLLWRTGQPYLLEQWPWIQNEDDARAEYRRLRSFGIVEPGSNRVRSVVNPALNLLVVDMNEWLFRRAALPHAPFPLQYTEAELDANVLEDDKLLAALLESGIQIRSTGRATLQYRLGGYSNPWLQGLKQGAPHPTR